MPEKKQSLLDTILRQIPGFGGYVDQQNRQESDEKTRAWMTERLQASKRHLDAYGRALADAAKIDDLPLCDKLRKGVDRVLARVRSSVQGYSGLFDAKRIDEDRLEDVYDCDAWLLDEIDALAGEMDRLGNSDAPSAEVIPPLLQKLDAIVEKLDQREKLLKQLIPQV